MKICFTIDDVIRAKTLQIGKIYKKYIDPKIDLNAIEFDTNDYKEIFGFDDENEWNKFLYEDYTYEIFARAPVKEKGVDKELNLWLLNLNDEYGEDIDVMIANPYEFNISIGLTYFFMAAIASRIREAFFPFDSMQIWDRCDILVTSDPSLIENKPEGKICIKIEMPYNKDIESDYSYKTLGDFLKDKETFEKLTDKYGIVRQ